MLDIFNTLTINKYNKKQQYKTNIIRLNVFSSIDIHYIVANIVGGFHKTQIAFVE